jgi:hypothetical protein
MDFAEGRADDDRADDDGAEEGLADGVGAAGTTPASAAGPGTGAAGVGGAGGRGSTGGAGCSGDPPADDASRTSWLTGTSVASTRNTVTRMPSTEASTVSGPARWSGRAEAAGAPRRIFMTCPFRLHDPCREANRLLYRLLAATYRLNGHLDHHSLTAHS